MTDLVSEQISAREVLEVPLVSQDLTLAPFATARAP